MVERYTVGDACSVSPVPARKCSTTPQRRLLRRRFLYVATLKSCQRKFKHIALPIPKIVVVLGQLCNHEVLHVRIYRKILRCLPCWRTDDSESSMDRSPTISTVVYGMSHGMQPERPSCSRSARYAYCALNLRRNKRHGPHHGLEQAITDALPHTWRGIFFKNNTLLYVCCNF